MPVLWPPYSEDVCKRGFTVIIDMRGSKWDLIKPLLKTLQEAFPAEIHVALIIKPDNFWQKQKTNFGSSKFIFEVRLTSLLAPVSSPFWHPPISHLPFSTTLKSPTCQGLADNSGFLGHCGLPSETLRREERLIRLSQGHRAFKQSCVCWWVEVRGIVSGGNFGIWVKCLKKSFYLLIF